MQIWPFLGTLALGCYPAGLRYLSSVQTKKQTNLALERLSTSHKSTSNTTRSAIASPNRSACVLFAVQHACCSLYSMHVVHCTTCVLFTVQHACCSLYSMRVVHCTACVLFTVQHACCSLYSMRVVHCTACVLFTVQHACCSLYSMHVVHCTACMLYTVQHGLTAYSTVQPPVHSSKLCMPLPPCSPASFA